jgi:integrase
MQRGEIRQWGKNWQLRYWQTEFRDGKVIKHRVAKKLAPISREYQTAESVQALADQILLPLNLGNKTPESTDSLDTYLQTFLEHGEGGRGEMLKPSTLAGYRDVFRLVRPHIVGLELRKVRTPDIDRILRAVAAAGGRKKKNKLAHSTHLNTKNFLSSAFRYAVRHGVVDSNPVRDAAIPRGEAADTYAYSIKEIHETIKALKKYPVSKAAVTVAAFTGLRLSEMKGLRWEDYRDGELHITRSVWRGHVSDTKTLSSKAPVPVIGIVKDALADHLAQNSGDGYIFHGDTSEPLIFENLARREIIPVLEKARIEWHGFHAFRRGLSSNLYELGVPVEIRQSILRHSDPETTKKHYTKASRKRSKEAMSMAEKAYRKIERAAKRTR